MDLHQIFTELSLYPLQLVLNYWVNRTTFRFSKTPYGGTDGSQGECEGAVRVKEKVQLVQKEAGQLVHQVLAAPVVDIKKNCC